MVSLLSFTFWADDGTVDAGVFGDLLERGFDGPADDFDAEAHGLRWLGLGLDVVQHLGSSADDGYPATGQDAFFNGGAAGVQGIFNAGLLLFHGHFGGGADVDLGDPAGQLGEAFLEFLFVVVAGGGVDLGLEGVDAALDGGFFAGTFDDGGVVFVDADLFGPAEAGTARRFRA